MLDTNESTRAGIVGARIGGFSGATLGLLGGALIGMNSRFGALIVMAIASSIIGATGAMHGAGAGALTGWLTVKVGATGRWPVAVLLGLLFGPLFGYAAISPLISFFGPFSSDAVKWATSLFGPVGALHGVYIAYIVQAEASHRRSMAVLWGMVLGPLLGYAAMLPLLGLFGQEGGEAVKLCIFLFALAGAYMATLIRRDLDEVHGPMPLS